jgi:uncharacterized membrane protein YphA (DoxX/SURF4 family)
VVGAGELLAGLALLFPRLSAAAALALAFEMLGALVTHLRVGETPMAAATVVLGALLLGTAALRRRAPVGAAEPLRSSQVRP